ncbi:hypothetical protein [Aquibium oceanicum]|nr:hypothetical protein [Aquibium oceanicum]
MNTYAVAVYYRFDDTYLKRYDGLVGMLASYAEVWMEAPSMFLLRTDEKLATVENKIRKAGFQPETDILIVIDVTGREARYAGHIEHKDRLEKILPAQKATEHPEYPFLQNGGKWATGEWETRIDRQDAAAGDMPRRHGFSVAVHPQFGFKNFGRPFDPRQ